MHTAISRVGSIERTLMAPARRRPVATSDRRTRVLEWVSCLERLKRRREERLSDAALFVVVHEPDGRARLRVRERFAPPTAVEPLALSLGRHPGCDLPGLREASLRHALVLAWPTGASPVEVIDLRSNTGLVLSSGRAVTRLRGAGPLRFVAGNDDVTVLYARPGAPLEVDLPDELDGWVALEEGHMLGADDEQTRLPKTHPSFVAHVGGALVRLADRHVLDPRGYEVIPVRAHELTRGVLLGRYTRCHTSGYFQDDEHVSRVHALVLERDEKLHVVDAGSTHGTGIVDARDGRTLATLGASRRAYTLGSRELVEVGGKRVVFEVLR